MIELVEAGARSGITYRVRCTQKQVRELHVLALRYFPRQPFEPFPNAWTLFSNEGFRREAFDLFPNHVILELRELLELHGQRLVLLFEWRG